MSKIYLGIDPGSNGGLVWLDSDGSLLECQKMPSTPQDILSALGNWDTDDVVCFIEKVGFGCRDRVQRLPLRLPDTAVSWRWL